MSPDVVKCPLGDKIIPGLKLKNKTKQETDLKCTHLSVTAVLQTTLILNFTKYFLIAL